MRFSISKIPKKTKLISSRITFFENKYFEVSFTFYGETYTIYLDQYLSKSYYGGKKPSDQYELDLLNKSLKSASSNELDIAKKTIQKLSKYDFISINEKYIVAAIDDTQNIYEAKNEIDNRNYSYAESTLRLVSDEKKNESDYERLIKRLNRIYFTNTTIVGLIGFAAIYLKLVEKDNQFTLWNILISIGIVIISWLVNRATRSIHWSRWLVLLLFGIQFFGIIYYENKEGDNIRSEKALQESFDSFKSSHYTVFNGQDSIILIEPTGQERRNYYLPKGKPYILDIGGGQKTRERIAESNMYLNIEQQSFENASGSYKVTVALKDNNSGFRFDIEANYDDIRFDNDDNDIEIRYMRNSIDEFKLKNISTMFISNSSWQAIKGGAKSIEASKARENQVSAPSTEEINPTIQIGAQFQGGIIIQVDETGEHGLIISMEDLGDGNWNHAVELCDNFTNENYDDWRLPTLEELRIVYANKNVVSNFQENWYWSSTEDPENNEQAYHLGFISGDEMSVPKEHGKFVRAIRSF